MTTTKKIAAYTIDKNILKQFDKTAQKLGSNKSKVIQLLIEWWLRENNDKK